MRHSVPNQRIPRWRIHVRRLRSFFRHLFANEPITTALITGSNGKTTTTNMLGRILREAGYRVGKANTEGIYLDNEQIWRGDASGYKGAGWIMTEPGVTAAVLETARGGILIHGLYVKKADVAALTNVGLEHIGDKGMSSQAVMLAHKKHALDAAERAVVLNADDPVSMNLAAAYGTRKTILVSFDEDNPFVRNHQADGGRSIVVAPGSNDDAIWYLCGEDRREIVCLNGMPATQGGLLRFNVHNAMTAAGLAIGLDVPVETIARGLSVFRLDNVDSPGRFMFVEGYPLRILVNYGSNPIALKAVMPGIDAISVPGRRICLVTTPDNRADDHFAQMASELAGHFDLYIVYEVARYVRRQPRGWTLDQVGHELMNRNISKQAIVKSASIDDAMSYVATNHGTDDLLVVFGETNHNALNAIASNLMGEWA